jgi:precorrin-2/cobalt-factor-2 C20-methyltransferase
VSGAAGRLIGVGVGPGDAELMTLKAVRALAEADVVGHFAKAGRASHARAVAERFLRPDVAELAFGYPVTTEIAREDPAYAAAIDAFFAEAADAVARELARGRTVAVLSEGDPLFYGSYMHLHVRLAHRYPTEVIPGVTSLSGCWSAVGLPLAQGDEVLTVLPGTLAEPELVRRLEGGDAAVVIKIGRNLAKVRRALREAKRLDAAVYVERGTMQGAHALALRDKADDAAPYFAVVLVPGWRHRP